MSEYIFTNNESIPAVITVGDNSSPVWIQQRWNDGEYASFIRNNGCGHCCTAMVLNLCGTKIDPYEEYLLCRKMWGEPDTGKNEYHFQSVSGITKVIKSFDVPCEYFGIPAGESDNAARHIEKSLEDGRLVIFWSHPSDKLENNPFSMGEHYVLAFGINKDGKIMIANSSDRIPDAKGVQLTDRDTVSKVLYEGSMPLDFTWGRGDLKATGGYVVAGWER